MALKVRNKALKKMARSQSLFYTTRNNLLCLRSFLPLEEENYILSPYPLELTSSIFTRTTIHLQLSHIYFTNGKKKSYRNGHQTP